MLDISRGDIAAIVGCGGKTSLMLALAQENREKNTVLIGTTTHIFPPEPQLYDHKLTSGDSVCPGNGVTLAYREDGAKLRGLPKAELCAIAPLFDYCFLEADGSKCLPLKGWANHEPAVPAFTTATVAVAVLWPLGMPLSEQNAHRLEAFCTLTGARPGEPVKLRHIAAMIMNPGGMMEKAKGKRVLFLNQIESDAAAAQAKELAALLPQSLFSRIIAGSLRENRFSRIE